MSDVYTFDPILHQGYLKGNHKGKNMEEYSFDPITHEGSINGVVVPSVTSVLRKAGFLNYGSINSAILNKAAKFGTALHRAAALDDKDNLDESTCHPMILEYLKGWRNFRNAFKPEFIGIEKRLYSKKWMFDGGYDRLAIVHQMKKATLVDIKSGNPEKFHASQLAGYKILIEENMPEVKIKNRWTVYLNPSFSFGFKIVPHKGISDEREFLTALHKTRVLRHEPAN